MLTGIKHSLLHNYLISSFDFNLSKSLISRGKKKTLHHQPPCVRLMFNTIGQRISRAKGSYTQSLGLNLSIHDQ